jgi:uncharacterized protein (TIRG00374 family)
MSHLFPYFNHYEINENINNRRCRFCRIKPGHKIKKNKKEDPSISGFINIMKEGLDRLYSNPSAILLSIIIFLPVWFFEISGTYLAAKAIGYPISFSLATVAGITSFLSQIIPVTPAGIGVYEGTMAGVFVIFGIPLSMGISLALVDHFIRASVTLIFGIISSVHLGFASRTYFVEKRNMREVDVD